MVSQAVATITTTTTTTSHSRGGGHRHERKNSDDSVSGLDNSDNVYHHDHAPPFLPLEETNDSAGNINNNPVVVMARPAVTSTKTSTNNTETIPSSSASVPASKKRRSSSSNSSNSDQIMTRIKTLILRFRQNNGCEYYTKYISLKKIISFGMFFILFLIVWDALFTSPENRWLQPDFSDSLMKWVQIHPMRGWIVLVFTLAIAVIFMIPIGTPITLGCGYIYKGLYGWKLGIFIATIVSMGGSALGAVTCFLLGRYLMRDQVRLWIKKYPLFDAIDIAAAEHGLRIMAMLYLTPILPLGPVSYMCGTTSMALSSFILAKVASLPLMLLYVFIGASAGALIGSNQNKDGNVSSAHDEFKSIEENTTLIVSGILLSFVMIAGITHNIKKELNKILERQEKHKPGEKDKKPTTMSSSSRDLRGIKESSLSTGDDNDGSGSVDDNEEGMEMGSQLVRQRRAG